MLTRVDDIRRAPSVYASGKPLIDQMINHSFQTYCMSLKKSKHWDLYVVSDVSCSQNNSSIF